VLCPPSCKDNGTQLNGVGLYSADSSICKAAIQAGVIFNDLGGIAQLTISYPRKYVWNTEKFDIISNKNDPEVGPILRTFFVSKANSCSSFMTAMEDQSGIIAS
jgi:hypothetical protein